MSPCELDDYAALLGAVSAEDGIVHVPFSEMIEGRAGTIHGGAIAGLLEIAAYRCLDLHLDPSAAIRLITMTIDYLRTTTTLDTHAVGMVKFRSRRLLIVQTRAWQADANKSVAEGHWHFLVESPR